MKQNEAIEYIKNIGKTVLTSSKNPMAYLYAGTFSALAGATSALGAATIQDGLERGLGASAKNLLFFGPVNIGYAKAIDYVANRFSKHPYLAANTVCLATNAAFATYAYLTGDNNTDLHTIANAAIPVTAFGLGLTNNQVRQIIKKKRLDSIID